MYNKVSNVHTFVNLVQSVHIKIILLCDPAQRLTESLTKSMKQEGHVNMFKEPFKGGHAGVISLPLFGGPVQSPPWQAWLMSVHLA
jgi:hypothetical protein